jgi:hypothetical protein
LWEVDSVTGPVNVKFTHHEMVMRMYRAGWAFGIAILFVACKGMDCGEGRERPFQGIRESSVVYWRERYSVGNKPETVEHNVCMQLCYEAAPDAIPRFGDCRDLQLDGGTAGAPGTGGDTGAGGSNGAGGAYAPIPVEGEPTYSVVCITGPIEDCGKLIR